MDVIYTQCRILLEAGDSPVEAFEKQTAAFAEVSQDPEARKKFAADLKGFIAYVWPEVRKKSLKARTERRNA